MTVDAGSITVHRDVPFRETTERRLHVDVYEPPESGPRPAICYVHGGGFVRGDKGQHARHALEFADRGFVTAECQYRLGGEATFPAAPIDVKAAVEWLKTEGRDYGVDPDRIAIAGHSAGANLAAMVGVTADDPAFEPDGFPGVSADVEAVVGYAGIYDFFPFEVDPDPHVTYLDGTSEAAPEAYELASPLGQEGPGTPPTLLMHATDDDVLSFEQSERFHEALRAVTSADLELFDEGGHTFLHHDATYPDTIDRTAAFLGRHLGTSV